MASTASFRVALVPAGGADDLGLEALLGALHDTDPVVRLRGAHRVIRAWSAGDRWDPALHAAACEAHGQALAFLDDPDPRLLRPAVALARDLLLLRDEGFLSPGEEDEAEAAVRTARARIALALAVVQGAGGEQGVLPIERSLGSALVGFDAVLAAWWDPMGSLEPTEEAPAGPICTTPVAVPRTVTPPRPSREQGLIERCLALLRG